MYTADLYIFTCTAMTLLALFAVQVISLRRIDNAKAARLSIRLYLWGILVHVLFSAIAYSFVSAGTTLNFFAFISVSLFYYLLLGYILFLFVFGIAATSVRTQLTDIIYQEGDRGITHEEILKKYNSRLMVKNRLERLLRYGVIVKTNRGYQAKSTHSLISTANFMWIFLQKIYARN